MPVVVHGTVACTYVASGMDALAASLARLAFPGPLKSLREQLHSSWSVGKDEFYYQCLCAPSRSHVWKLNIV